MRLECALLAKGTFHFSINKMFGKFKIKSKANKNQINCLSSITRGVVAPSPEPEAHVLSIRAFRVELKLRSAGF